MNFEMMFTPEMMDEFHSIEQLEDSVTLEKLGEYKSVLEENERSEKIVGNPEKADDHWHIQAEKNSCAIACQEFIAEQLLNKDFSEKEMIEYAKKRDWYTTEEGTSQSDVGKLLEVLGLDVERTEGMRIAELVQSLAEGKKAICGVSTMILEEPSLAELPGIKANHVVEVIGFDFSNPMKPQVILNDSGTENGRGIRHDLDVFLDAWKASRNFAVIVDKKETI